MKKFRSIVLVLLLLLLNVFLFTGCENTVGKNLYVSNDIYNYAIVLHNNVSVLHKISSIHFNNTNSVSIETDCCHNIIYFSNINCILFRDLPDSCWYDVICEDC